MEKDNYEIRYLPSFVKQFESILNYMAHTLKNSDAADKFYKNVIEQIEKRSQKPEGYEKYISKSHPNILSIFLAEILDKIYLIKIFIFLKKFELLSMHISLYLFYHILLLSLLCGFFTINVIKRIWEESNYPSINFYLLYGLISHIIIYN